ncbi:hypothetical protein [Aeromonas sanarellii]
MQFKHLVMGSILVSTTALATFTPPAGFRDMLWGSSPSSVAGGMTLEDDDHDSKCYTRKQEKLKIGDADLKWIGYCYHKDRLFGVVVKFDGVRNFSKIKEALVQKYGKPIRQNSYAEDYLWAAKDSDVGLSLTFNDIRQNGEISYLYMPIFDERTKDREQRAAQATNDL